MDYEKLMRLKTLACERLEKLDGDDLEKAADIEAAKNLASLCEKLCFLLEEGDSYSQGMRYTAGGHSYGRHYVRGHYSRDDGRRRMLEQIDDMMASGNLTRNDYSTLERAREILDC